MSDPDRKTAGVDGAPRPAVRPAGPDDLDGVDGARGADEVLVAPARGSVAALLSIHRAGGPTEPGVPRVQVHLPTGAILADRQAEVLALLEAAWATLRAEGCERVILPWDAMDAAGQRLLATSGFRPAGTWPYFELGGGAVEHVMGYRDPVGSTLDLARVHP